MEQTICVFQPYSVVHRGDACLTHDIRWRDVRMLAYSQEFLPGCRQERAEGEYEGGAKAK